MGGEKRRGKNKIGRMGGRKERIGRKEGNWEEENSMKEGEKLEEGGLGRVAWRTENNY